MSKIDLEIAENLEFEEGDCAVTIKKDGSIGKVIVPKMNTEMLNSEGYKALLEVVEILHNFTYWHIKSSKIDTAL